MPNAYKSLLLTASLLLVPASGWTHHGSGISYDVTNLWTTWATVTEFQLAESTSIDDVRPHIERRQGRALGFRAADESFGTRQGGMDQRQERCSSEARHASEALHWHVTMVHSRANDRIIQKFEWTWDNRDIWMDGRPIPDVGDYLPRHNGYSVGRWEGDTLVVSSTGFDDRQRLDQYGYPISEEAVLEERCIPSDESLFNKFRDHAAGVGEK